MRLTRLTVSLSAAAFLSIGIAGALANNALRATPTAVAVIDIERAFDALSEKSAVEVEIRAQGERLAREEQERRQRIGQLRDDLGVLAAGSRAFREKEEELSRAIIDLQVWTQFQQQRLQREHVLHTERLYRKMLEAIARVAEDEGYDLVLFREATGRLQADTPQELAAQIQMRKILYANSRIDFTDQVVQRMNNAFEAR